MPRLVAALLFFLVTAGLKSQDLPAFELTPQWLQKIESLAPSPEPGAGQPPQKILVFSLHTGYEHWAIPHTEAVVKLLADKSGLAQAEASRDISVFEPEKLQEYVAVVLNNTCPERDHRDIFYDVFRKDPEMPEAQRKSEAARLEKNLIDYVLGGGGLVLLHGGTTMQNNSMAFSRMTGGSFDFHPPQQPVQIHLAEPGHPLLKGFAGTGITFTDEPYFFKNAYAEKNFRPLLYMEVSELTGLDREFKESVRYISWIKRYGKGRIFVCAPTHNAQNFENPQFLQFLVDGMRYATGQLQVPDAPLKSP
ncbi:ThuA domain-containing protein [Robiginitalea sp. SC105]|uniref:ThuA domain-containing protein n=1 Tax=Robiginitalea sp. SC105 TaxID=2762332 RepID=UPI00163AF5AB|nr:ThuA domain-containing protein [Robiginitalea sp. SC105]MBC2840805.1 ThuA domain-containing protein [Robiginitalea sp. SC105]